jgi:hypothetical protein
MVGRFFIASSKAPVPSDHRSSVLNEAVAIWIESGRLHIPLESMLAKVQERKAALRDSPQR